MTFIRIFAAAALAVALSASIQAQAPANPPAPSGEAACASQKPFSLPAGVVKSASLDTGHLGLMYENYPKAARRARHEGAMTMCACVRADGRTENVQIAKSSGFEDLDKTAFRFISNMKAKPARNDKGEPVDHCNPDYRFDIVWKLPPR